MGGSCDENEGGKSVQENTERIHRREKSNWKCPEGDGQMQWTRMLGGC